MLVPHTAGSPAELAALTAVPVTLDVVVRPVGAGGVPDSPGAYAWWGRPGLLPGITGPAHPDDPALELLYVGIAPKRATSRRTLRKRVTQDHLRRTRKSTLRRGLAAFLWQTQQWTPALSSDGRPALDTRSEALLSAWMREHLLLTWAVHPEPWTVETAVIALMEPPLNVDENTSHPLYPLVRATRDTFIAAARAG